MSLSDLKPFGGLSVLTTELDEIEVGHLLRTSDLLSLICQDCGGKQFRITTLIPAEMEVITGEHIVITHVEYKETLVNRVVRCVHCNSEDFVTINNSGSK
jgi:hypothetical protein